MLRKFLIWVVKNLLVLLLVAFIFSTLALDVPGMVKGAFGDVFAYASPQAQKEVVGKLTIACSALDGKNPSELQSQMSGSPLPLDFSKIGSLCKDYNSGKLNDKEFFFGVIGTAIPGKLELPKIQALEKYNSIMDFLSKNKIYYAIILLALAGILFLLAGSLNSFMMILAGISFSMGILILLPYAAIILYQKFVGFDTTPLLSSILQGSFSFDIKAVISVVLLMILRTYTSFIVTLGAIFMGVGIAGKIYGWRLKKKTSTAEPKSEKKSGIGAKAEKTKEKPAKKTKEEEDEDYNHRDRSAKEILEELDEIHKKKTKEKNKEE